MSRLSIPCAIYTRKSSEEGLEQGFNSLDAQREACAAYILSQKAEGWKALPDYYDDGGYSGGNMERPALQRLMQDIADHRVKIIVVYKVDRLTRSLADFAKLVEQFDARGVSFVSVTQQFNTTSSMGRLTLNVLLSFAQFEREVTGERIRDKIAASKKKGMWMGGTVPIGYLAKDRTLVIDEGQAERVRGIFRLYIELGCVRSLKKELDQRNWTTPLRTKLTPDAGEESRVSGKSGASGIFNDTSIVGGQPFGRGHLYRILTNPLYRGMIRHKEELHPGQHLAIIDEVLWAQVQALLVENRQGDRQRRTSQKVSLLAGKVFHANGERLIPSHACKGNRRYRYYVSESLVDLTKGDAHSNTALVLRIPAPELEGAVQQLVLGFLDDRTALLHHLGKPDAAVYQQVIDRAAYYRASLEQGTSQEQASILAELVERVVVSASLLEVAVRHPVRFVDSDCHERSQDGVTPSDRPSITISQAVSFRRSGFGIRMILPNGKGSRSATVDPRLLNFVRRGSAWFHRLATEGASPSVIARDEKLSPAQVQQMIYVAFLAPDIVQAIESGQQPLELTSQRLKEALPLPSDWIEQRKLLGFVSA